MIGLVDSLARRLVRRGIRRGLAEGSTLWVAIGALAWLVRLLARPDAPKVARERLRLGETIVVTHAPAPPSRRARRRAARRGEPDPAEPTGSPA